jgi:osmotically-inducible protein OsmY
MGIVLVTMSACAPTVSPAMRAAESIEPIAPPARAERTAAGTSVDRGAAGRLPPGPDSSGPRPEARPEPRIDPDARIENDVNDAIRRTPATRWGHVSATVGDGIVTIRGSANSSNQSEALVRVASSVPGVRRVILEVDLPPEYRRDAGLAADVRRRLDEDVRLVPTYVAVAVNRRQVRLSGVVGTLFQRDAAVADAWAPGVEDVDTYALRVGQLAAERAQSRFADRYLAALSSPALMGLEAELHPEARASFPGLPTAEGRRAAVGLHELLFSAFGGRSFRATRVFAANRVVIVEWVMTGSQEGDWMQVPATRKVVRFKGLTALWLDPDGAITDAHVYFDVAAVRSLLEETNAERADGVREPLATPQTVVQQGSAKEMDAAATMRGALEALDRGDETGYVSRFADDVALYTLRSTAPSEGRSAVRAYFDRSRAALAELDVVVTHLWGIGNFAIAEYCISGVQVRPIDSQPLIPYRVVRLHVVDVAELRDDRIARLWRYDNPIELAGEH